MYKKKTQIKRPWKICEEIIIFRIQKFFLKNFWIFSAERGKLLQFLRTTPFLIEKVCWRLNTSMSLRFSFVWIWILFSVTIFWSFDWTFVCIPVNREAPDNRICWQNRKIQRIACYNENSLSFRGKLNFKKFRLTFFGNVLEAKVASNWFVK